MAETSTRRQARHVRERVVPVVTAFLSILALVFAGIYATIVLFTLVQTTVSPEYGVMALVALALAALPSILLTGVLYRVKDDLSRWL